MQATIDLANPVLPEEPDFVLLDATRRVLILPHGGLVRQDGSDPGDAPLAAADITVLVAGAPRTVVTAPPAAGEVRADPRVGTLTFGDALAGGGNGRGVVLPRAVGAASRAHQRDVAAGCVRSERRRRDRPVRWEQSTRCSIRGRAPPSGA